MTNSSLCVTARPLTLDTQLESFTAPANGSIGAGDSRSASTSSARTFGFTGLTGGFYDMQYSDSSTMRIFTSGPGCGICLTAVDMLTVEETPPPLPASVSGTPAGGLVSAAVGLTGSISLATIAQAVDLAAAQPPVAATMPISPANTANLNAKGLTSSITVSLSGANTLLARDPTAAKAAHSSSRCTTISASTCRR